MEQYKKLIFINFINKTQYKILLLKSRMESHSWNKKYLLKGQCKGGMMQYVTGQEQTCKLILYR